MDFNLKQFKVLSPLIPPQEVNMRRTISQTDGTFSSGDSHHVKCHRALKVSFTC